MNYIASQFFVMFNQLSGDWVGWVVVMSWGGVA